jgi:hypothetical protein
VNQDRLKKADREWKEQKKTIKEKHAEELPALVKRARLLFNAWIRKRDAFKPCISCGAEWKPGFQAGHYFKDGSYQGLRHNEMNVNGQCRRCNMYLGGNESGYVAGLIERYGLGAFQNLQELARLDKNRKGRLGRDYYKGIIEKYRASPK